jgi:hypothetical protein
MNLTTLSIDLAKTSFSLVGMDQQGKVVLRKTLKRAQLLPFTRATDDNQVRPGEPKPVELNDRQDRLTNEAAPSEYSSWFR